MEASCNLRAALAGSGKDKATSWLRTTETVNVTICLEACFRVLQSGWVERDREALGAIPTPFSVLRSLQAKPDARP
jgi:hypothetical protein